MCLEISFIAAQRCLSKFPIWHKLCQFGTTVYEEATDANAGSTARCSALQPVALTQDVRQVVSAGEEFVLLGREGRIFSEGCLVRRGFKSILLEFTIEGCLAHAEQACSRQFVSVRFAQCTKNEAALDLIESRQLV
jgi:hypothetical protein